MLDKNQVRVIFLFKFKIGHKAAVTTCNINNAFGPGTANDHTVQWWFKKFCKGDESLEDEECSGQPSEVDHDQLWWSSYSFPRSCQAQLNVDHSMVVRHLKQIGRVKKFDKWLPHELTEKKNHCFEVSSSPILCNNNETFFNQIVMHDERWTLYNNQW